TTLGHRTAQNLNFTISAVDIGEALDKAPQAIDALNPTKYKEYDAHAARRSANVEIDTPKGRQLLSQTKEIFLINATSKLTTALDPTGAIWDKVIRRSQVIVERCKIDLSFGAPADDAAVMFVIFKMKPTRKGTVGTQELSVEAFLVCLDPSAKKDKNPFCLVWKEEATIGTISLEALATGNFPRTADDKLAKFFQSFQSAYLRSTKEPVKTDDAKKSPGDSKKTP
ncbi:MAG TPA: hypothetical protein VFG20_17075, partial [Planctomycetaceae bacterium]|nr:hypothetical protein [Planctomycetaceae bacterium]